ncbi:MAG: MerR family transcriptional regulator [Mycobacteriaceae bacterium]|nr:MerR family transcriptional regulator [Mycobacteriaceae bacterium]
MGQQEGGAGADGPSGSALSIGAVLDLLRPDFPDVTISKIRFLESEGLVSPERSPSGYRRFSMADCDRLRFVLTAQREHYLPLRVIKEQLDGRDSAGAPADPESEVGVAPPRRLGVVREPVSAQDLRPARPVRLTRVDLTERAGVTDAFLRELAGAGLVTPGAGGYFDADAAEVVAAARALCDLGLEVRHLRGFKLAADREAALAAQIAGPVAKGRDAGARERAADLARQFAALAVGLHAALVKTAVAQELD